MFAELFGTPVVSSKQTQTADFLTRQKPRRWATPHPLDFLGSISAKAENKYCRALSATKHETARHLIANQRIKTLSSLYLQAKRCLYGRYPIVGVTLGYRMTAAAASSLTDLGRVDRRSRSWRRRQARRAEIVTGLGGEDRLTPHQRELVDLLLGIGQLVESFQAKLAAGHDVDSERYLAAVKEQRRIVGELGLSRGKAGSVPNLPPIRERLRTAGA